MIWIYLFIMSLIAFLFYGWDKYKAVHGTYRISERTLLMLAILGGTPGALLGMFFFHHKTRKLYFRIGIPLIMLIQLAVGMWFIR